MKKTEATGRVHSIESFGAVDGPGVRFVVFMQGCPMRCQFCHNPDTWKINDINSMSYTSDDLLAKALQYKKYWGGNGGITVSGGEPLVQLDFLLEFFQKAKLAGIHITLDTCGQPFTKAEPFFSKFKKILMYTDLILLDIKHIDTTCHKELTGFQNYSILELARYLSEVDKPVWIRHVLIPKINDQEAYLKRLSLFIQGLSNVKRVEVLPYHTMGKEKWERLGLEYPLVGIEPPTNTCLKRAEQLLQSNSYS
ncbi:pyruvate formate-lyase-activating protein [Enterococcus sp. AZ072]|uniref:pyruvate formate-lyase-activating protein n=1 Tax=unclassified Enterococcus TaxID=2608891 RepID=UPI003D2E4B21